MFEVLKEFLKIKKVRMYEEFCSFKKNIFPAFRIFGIGCVISIVFFGLCFGIGKILGKLVPVAISDPENIGNVMAAGMYVIIIIGIVTGIIVIVCQWFRKSWKEAKERIKKREAIIEKKLLNKVW